MAYSLLAISEVDMRDFFFRNISAVNESPPHVQPQLVLGKAYEKYCSDSLPEEVNLTSVIL